MNKLVLYGLYIFGILAGVSQFAKIFSSKTHFYEQNIMLVTAHPDDELMFFGPTLRHVLDPAKQNNVHLLVLSNGNSEGLGEIREQEQFNAARRIGLKEGNVVVLNDPDLQDSMDVFWDTKIVSRRVNEFIEKWKPKSIITFDKDGVSGHSNHRATFEGVLESSLSLAEKDPEFSMFTLFSVPLWRKYIFTMDSLVCKLIRQVHTPYQLIMPSSEYHVISQGLLQHQSQMTWYRRLWMFFSRYMVVNELYEVNFGRALRSETFEQEAKAKAASIFNNRERGQNRQTKVVEPIATVTKNTEVTRHKPSFSTSSVETSILKSTTKETDIVHEEL